MPMKATIFFQLGQASWTESHYSNTYTDPTTPAAAAAGINLVKDRVPLLGNGAFVTRLRLSRTDIARVVVNPSLQGVVVGLPINNPPSQPVDSDQPNASAILRCDDNAGHAKNLYLAGIPDDAIDVSVTSPRYWYWQAPWANAFKQYVLQLTQNWRFRVKSANLFQPVTALNQVQIPVPQISLVTPAQLAPGQTTPYEVTITGFRRINPRSPGLSGVYTVTDVYPSAAPATSWNYNLAETGNVQQNNFSKFGQIGLLVYTYVPYVNIAVSKAGTRKRGGSAGAPRGRSRSRV